MHSKILTYANDSGQERFASVSLPVNQKPHTCALMAHCFSDSENPQALSRICMALNQAGIAVLRYPFAGELADLGEILAAARFMESCYHSPSILIGHSQAGPAIVHAAALLPEVKALAVIGSPYQAGAMTSHLLSMQQPLLILHAPEDESVPFQEACEMFRLTPAPKSFVSLDGASHLLSRQEDAHYAGQVIGAWVQRYVNLEKRRELQVEKQVAARLGAEGYTTEIMVRHHGLTADEPEHEGGNDYGPSPYELVASALGACTAMTIHMYARRKKWPVEEVTVHLSHAKDYAKDRENTEEKASKIDHFERLIELRGDLSEEQRLRLLEIANKCPVHKTLNSPVVIESALK